MHGSVLKFVEAVVNEFKLAKKSTLEIGSYNINGSVREFFTGKYVGIDLEDGPGVDRVMSSYDLRKEYEAESFDVVVSTEQLEHDPKPWETMHNVKHVLKPGGFLVVTARGNGFKRHNEPDYYRFAKEAIGPLFELADVEPLDVKDDPECPGVFAVGMKPKPKATPEATSYRAGAKRERNRI